jgi:hypothetical protein
MAGTLLDALLFVREAWPPETEPLQTRKPGAFRKESPVSLSRLHRRLGYHESNTGAQSVRVSPAECHRHCRARKIMAGIKNSLTFCKFACWESKRNLTFAPVHFWQTRLVDLRRSRCKFSKFVLLRRVVSGIRVACFSLIPKLARDFWVQQSGASFLTVMKPRRHESNVSCHGPLQQFVSAVDVGIQVVS